MKYLTILWTSLVEGEWAMLEAVTQERAAKLTQVTLSTLATSVLPALAQGAVIAVVASDADATRAFSLGVDEVVRVGEVSPEVLERAIGRAELRAGARAIRDSSARFAEDDEWRVLSLFTSAIIDGLSGPLNSASSDWDALAREICLALVASDEFVRWAALITPTDEIRRLVALRARAPRSLDLRERLGEVRLSVVDAVALLRPLRDLVDESQGGSVRVDLVLHAVADLLRGYLGTWASLEVEDPSPCVTRVSSALIISVVTLIGNAIDAIRASHRADGHIVLRAAEREGIACVEIEDNGGGARPSPGLDSFEDYVNDPLRKGSARGASGVRERLRRVGGELLVDSDYNGTTVRLLLPIEGTGAVIGDLQAWRVRGPSSRTS